MLNIIFTLLTLTAVSGEKAATTEVDVAKSTIAWNATKVTGEHSGTINLSNGSLEFKGDKLTGGEITVDMTSINTTDLEGEWKDKLDGHLKSDDFFGVETYETATLKIKKVKATSDGFSITGDFTIKGKTESVTFPATFDSASKTFTTKITLDRTKFDIRYGSDSFFDNLGDKAISDEFTLDISLVTK